MKTCSLAICLLLASIACGYCYAPAALDEGARQVPQAISYETAQWLLKYSRARLSGRLGAAEASGQAAPRQATEPRPTTLFVTTYKHGYKLRPRPAVAIAGSISAALKTALDAVSTTVVSAQPEASAREATPDRIQIDILDGSLAPLARPADRHAAELIDVGVEGIAVETGDRTFYLLPAEILYEAIAAEDPHEQSAYDLLARAMTHLGLDKDAWKSAHTKLSRFRTVSFIEDSSHSIPLRLVRGTVSVGDKSKVPLLASARAAGDYLVRVQRPNGSFYYYYDPLDDHLNSRAYNMLRHAGTALSLFELYAQTRDARYLESARLAVSFLKTRFRAAGNTGGLYVLDNDGKVKLGGNGLALIALAKQAELDRRAADLESAKRLANLILAMQHRTGEFDSYYRLRGDEPAGGVSLYYPGEAILGLVSLYRVNGDGRLVEAARRGANYLIESQRRMRSLPPDAWLMQALEALHKIGREKKYAEHALALADAMMAAQYSDDAPLGYSGGFGPEMPRSTPAASRAEGLLAAYRLARETSDARASKIAAAIKASVRFQLSHQFNADNSFMLPNPARASGGFRAGFTSTRIRIDFVQHNISSLIGAADALY
jgi:AMMECR1 domain-containing protein